MFILDALGNVRTILLTIDQVAYSSIDNAYNMITKFARAEFFTNEAVVSIMRSTYIIIGLLALFKIALLLINAMISPDKLFEKGAGLGGIVKNICIMFVLLIAVPILFNESMKIQQVIVDNDYVNRLFGISAGSNSNIGDMFKTSAISALINPDSDIATLTTTTDASGNKIRQYVLRTKDKVGAEKATAAGEKCSSSNSSTHCEDAINDYNKAVLSNDQTARNHMFSTLINHVGDYIKTDGGQIYVYNYSMLITFIVGIGITYLLILFSFDLAERAIKLAILEVVSPLFIVTYIDPKSAKSGPFSSWLKEVGGTYVGLYIRLAALTLIIVLTNLWNSRKGDIDLGFWGEIVFILSLLIFAKQFPKWLAGLVGIKDFDGGLGGLGKKIGSAALVGGMLTKAGHTAYAAARGSVATAHAYRKAKKTGLSSEKERAHNRVKSNYSSNRAAGDGRVKSAFKGIGQSYFKKDAMKQNLKNFGTTAAAGGLGFLKGVASGGKIGVSGADLKDINAKVKADAKGEFNRLAPDYNSFANRAGNFISGIHGRGVESIIGTEADLRERKDNADNLAEAKKLYNNVSLNASGERMKVRGPHGKDVFVNPRGNKEINEAIGNATTEFGAYEQLGTNLVNSSGGKFMVNSSGNVVNDSGKQVASSLAEFGAQNMTLSGKLAIKSVVASNAANDVQAYQQCLQQRDESSATYTREINAYNDAQQKLSSNPEYSSAKSVVESYESSVQDRKNAGDAIIKIRNNADYVYLQSTPHDKLTPEEQNRLMQYNVDIKNAIDAINSINTTLKKEQTKYNDAISSIQQIESATGLAEMKASYENAAKNLKAWNAEIEKYNDKFKNTEVYKMDDNGNVTAERENPYVVSINGEKYNPFEDKSLIKLEEIKGILSSKASKAEEKYKNSMKSDKKE